MKFKNKSITKIVSSGLIACGVGLYCYGGYKSAQNYYGYQEEIVENRQKIEELNTLLSNSSEHIKNGLDEYIFNASNEVKIIQTRIKISDLLRDRNYEANSFYGVFYGISDAVLKYNLTNE